MNNSYVKLFGKAGALITASLLFVACQTTSQSYSYRPADHTGQAWSISAAAKAGMASDEITILIDGAPVLTGKVSMVTPQTTLHGEKDGHKIMAEVKAVDNGGISCVHVATVFIDNERVATLNF